jgi:Cobalamin synthesis protein cobW C-terminal domain
MHLKPVNLWQNNLRMIIIILMSRAIVAVAGPPGSGKTTWICQNLLQRASEASIFYVCPGIDSVPIDATYMASKCSKLNILTEDQALELLKQSSGAAKIYLEIGFHLQLSSLNALLEAWPCERVAVLPPDTEQTEWHAWANTIAVGSTGQTQLKHLPQLWRSPLSGQVLDPASLNTFWYELTQGAYGQVQRSKGIFDLADGRAFYFNFVNGLPDTDITELQVPRWLKGRPGRFSGIEVLGEALDQPTIAQTLKDCCLDDRAIAYYQQQIQDSLVTGDEAA